MHSAATVLLVVMLAIAGLLGLTYLGLVAAGASELLASKRHERAARRGWARQDVDPLLATRFHGGPFGLGRDPASTNVFRGEHGGRPFVAFEYALTDEAVEGGAGVRRRYAVVALELGVALPGLSVAPLQPAIPLFEEWDGSEVPIDHFSFPRLFRVRAAEPRVASALLHPMAIQQMLSWPTLGWRLDDGALVVVRAGDDHDALAVRHVLDMMTSVVDASPPELWERPSPGN